MKYQEYIEFGFTRVDIKDNVQFQETGYYGYYLTKKLTDSVSIQLYDSELNKPKLYMDNADKTYFVTLSIEQLKEILKLK